MTLPTAWILGTGSPEAWCGIYYMPTPTIVVGSYDNSQINMPNTPAPVQCGATSWTAKDGNGVVVGTGTMLATDESFTVVTDGVWSGGSAVVPGHYTIWTDAGSKGIVAGNVMICNSPSGLYVPDSSGDVYEAYSAFAGTAEDRDAYQYNPSLDPTGGYNGGGYGSSSIVANYAADPYFTGPQDSARPHRLWVSTNIESWDGTNPVPDQTQWEHFATVLTDAGVTGAWWEIPTNEAEDAGMSGAEILASWNAIGAAILAIDPTAKIMTPCSGGILNPGAMTLEQLGIYLTECTFGTPAAISTHMENSYQYQSNIVLLRQYFGAIKDQATASGFPDIDLWLTETGIQEGNFSVLHIRRAARIHTVMRFVAESFGWPKENNYPFTFTDHQGSGLSSYSVDTAQYAAVPGNIRAGMYAMHVQSEALVGTTCTPTSPPVKLSFGQDGGVGDSLFAGLHYTAAADDVVVLATNGIESDTVTLEVSDVSGAYAWDGWGADRAVIGAGNQITVDVDDLLTYLFLPSGSTVTVVDTGSNVITKFDSAVNLAISAGAVVNLADESVAGVLNNGSFGENNLAIPNTLQAGIVAPFVDNTVPDAYTFSQFYDSATPQVIDGIAILTAGPAFQAAGCSIVSFTVTATIEGTPTEVYSYTCDTAESFPVPSASTGNTDDYCVRTTWWKRPFGFLVPLELSGPATAIKVDITATDYFGQPDEAANTATGGTVPGADQPQQIQLAEIQILQINTTRTGPRWVARACG